MTYNELCEAILTAQEEMLKHKIEANSVTLNGRKYGKLIEDCPPNTKPTIFGMTVKADYALPDDYDFLVQYEPPQPQTNADRIRSMSDEELAEWFLRDPFIGSFAFCPPGTKDGEDCPTSPCELCWLEWLREEVEE